MSAVSTATHGEIVWFERRVARPGFTARDLSELAEWGSHPGRAVIVDDGPTALAQLYQGASPWASWAVARQDGGLLVWNCVTFADVGHYSCMAAALAALSGSVPDDVECMSNVVSFAAARRSRMGSDAAVAEFY